MSPNDLQEYLEAKIPLARFMQISVVRATHELVEIDAPLEPNRNVHGTLFGGSAAALGLLATWSLAFLRTSDAGLDASLVVRRHQMAFLRPVTGMVAATARFHSETAWPEFVAATQESGRGRLALDAVLESTGKVCARLHAEIATAPRVGSD